MRKATRWQDRVIPEPNTGCWLWQGRVEPGGHGQFTRDDKVLRVHRVVWEENNGPVPDGSIVAHTCGVRSCCNIDHMFLMTVADLRKSEALPWRERIEKQPGGCWLWTGSINKDGYGQVRIDKQTLKVHRLAWEEVNGPIPDGLRVCHHCDVPACCNPAHLFIGTQRDNVTDMINKGRFKGGSFLNALKTHCPQGHEYTPRNTMTYNGMRSCRQCMNERSVRYQRPRRVQ